MNKFHWIEAKQLDRVTNYSSRTEIIRFTLNNNIKSCYYCTYAKEKRYYGLKGNIIYLGIFKNKYLKAVEFRLLVILNTISIVLSEKNSIIMVNQYLIKHMLPANMLNKLFNRNNKFITDIRTTPTNMNEFESKMNAFHAQFKYAIKHFDGFSFITPFMERYIMSQYNKQNYKSVNWSSGVDIKLFDPENYNSTNNNKETFRLFYHGSISISRGNLNLIKASEKLIDKGYNIELIQVGNVVNKEIKTYIEDNQLNGWCKLLDPVSLQEIPQMIADCDLPVLPFVNFMAWRVSSPIKLMEYLAMGKKVLAPNMEAFTDVFGEQSELIFYFNTNKKNQTTAISNEIKKIIDTKALENGNFNSEARTFVAKKYTWEKQAAKLIEFCKKL